MTASSHLPAPHLMPLMRYRDLAEAMGWLEQAFGFEKQIAVADSDGAVIYGQMTYRGGLIMMGAVRDTDLDKLMRQPDEVGGVETQSCYLVVEDADQHYQRAVASGADVVLELKSDGLGRRGYSCRDPEGHIWSFGTYNPGRSLTSSVAPMAEPESEEVPAAEAPRNRRLLMGIGGLLLAAGAAGWLLYANGPSSDLANAREAERAYAQLVKVRAEKRQGEERIAALQRELDAERQRIAAAKGDAGAAQTQALAQEKAAREAAEKEIASLKDEIKRGAAEREAAVAAERQRLAAEKGDGEAKAALAQADALAKEKAAREAAEQTVASLKADLKREQAERQRIADAKNDAAAKDALAQAQALAKEKAERAAAEKAVVSLRDELRREQAESEAAMAAKRGLEQKLAAASKTSGAGEPAAAAETEVAAAEPDRIETSSMTRDDDDADPPMKLGAETKKSPISLRRDRRPQRSQRPRRTEGVSFRRYPTYVTDLKHVWPYQHWSQ
jgi:uncharacterized glyoxalase superfamily protein PhnB